MNVLSNISFKLKIPVILQVLLLVVIFFFYFSSEYEVRTKWEQTREMGAVVASLQSVTADIQLFLHGQGDFKKIETELREQSNRIDKLAIGASLAAPLKQIAAVLQDSSKWFQRNADIEKEVMKLTSFSIEQSDRFITETSARLANPGKERSVTTLERAVLAGAAVNSGANHSIQSLFLRMKVDPGLHKEMITFLETGISNASNDEKRLSGTPFAAMATNAVEANKKIKNLVLEFQANSEKIDVASKEIEKQSVSIRGELDRFSEKSMLAGYDFFRVKMVALLLIVSIAAGIIGILNWSLSRVILRPIREMTAVLHCIAQGEGDLTQRLPITSKDEIGEACSLFNTFIEKMHSIISNVASATAQVTAAAGSLTSTAEQIATGAEQVAAQSGTVATAGEEMSATSGEIAQNCQMAAEGSRVASEAAVSGAQVVGETIAVMNNIASQVTNSARAVESLGSRSDQIGEIVGTIEDIADQTNLLALNAAIEAARAGEQGRGFAVVADEVRALAERTTKATREIGEMIKTIQRETRGAVTAMEEGVKQVSEGSEKAASSGRALENIIDQINSVTQQIHQVATAAEQQTATTSEISHNMQQITEVVSQTARGAHESSVEAHQLARLSDDLHRLICQFKLA